MAGIARQISRRLAKAEKLDEKWKRQLAAPLLERLGPEWIREDGALAGLNYPNMRAFWAVEIGQAERRRRWGILGGPWMIRLTKEGWAEQ